MSSFDEENLYEIVDEFRDTESASQPLLPPLSAQTPFLNAHHTKNYILQEIVESRANNAEADVLGSVRKKLVDAAAGKINIGLKKWLVESLINDGYNASLCHTCWPTTLNCPGGEYEYIDILREGRKGQCPLMRVIVDIDFRSQFELARPTSNYKQLCDILPSIFVGDEQKLKKIISIVCGEAKNSFRERGRDVPPWRTPCYMLSKWFSPSHNKLQASNTSTTGLELDHDRAAKVDVFAPPKLMMRQPSTRKYVGVRQCGLSSQFSSMSTAQCS